MNKFAEKKVVGQLLYHYFYLWFAFVSVLVKRVERIFQNKSLSHQFSHRWDLLGVFLRYVVRFVRVFHQVIESPRWRAGCFRIVIINQLTLSLAICRKIVRPMLSVREMHKKIIPVPPVLLPWSNLFSSEASRMWFSPFSIPATDRKWGRCT